MHIADKQTKLNENTSKKIAMLSKLGMQITDKQAKQKIQKWKKSSNAHRNYIYIGRDAN